jgi:hypothetical protein
VAWSDHELDVVKAHARMMYGRFAARYVNARTFGVRWRNRCHAGHKPTSNALADYLTLIGYDVPDRARPGRGAETIRILTDALKRGRAAHELTANQRQRWADLREHNRHDCTGMRSIVMLAATEVGDTRRRSREWEAALTAR